MNNTPQRKVFILSDYLKQKRNVVNSHLENILDACDPTRELTRAMAHSLMAGGKRIRPVLAMAAAEAVGDPDGCIALPSACAIEMIHTYSLIHDDLPAMDNDDMRRGKPTCHKAFSEATAILAGDALLTHAFHVLTTPENYFKTFPEKSALFSIIGIISQAAGVNGMVEGQMRDMLSFSSSNNLSQGVSSQPASITEKGSSDSQLTCLKTIHMLKTGKMIMASLKAGAVSAGGDQTQCACLTLYAEKIGLAFQVTDDILNVEGDPVVMGKACGSDALNDKMTYPALLGLEASKDYSGQLIDEAKHALSGFDEKRVLPLHFIADYILTRSR